MVITVLTDFGDYYVGVMKGVMVSKTNSQIIDIYNNVPKQDIKSGAFILLNTVSFFPEGTVHCVVVDPGVGTNRDVLVIESGNQFFIGPDNGVLLPAAKDIGNIDVYKVESAEAKSNTFHGRDIFAPLAAEIAEGNREYRGNKFDDYMDLNLEGAEFYDNKIKGNVRYIDDFGNIITNIDRNRFLEKTNFGSNLMINNIEIPLVKTYSSVQKGSILCTIGSHDTLEISVNQGSANNIIDLDIGDNVEIIF